MKGPISRSTHDWANGFDRLRVEMAALTKAFQEAGRSITAFNESWGEFATKQRWNLVLTLWAIIHKAESGCAHDAHRDSK